MKSFTLLIFLISQSSFAAVSASREYILDLINADAKELLTKNFDLDSSGECLRAGRHTSFGGLAILPCSIDGKLKTSMVKYIIKFDSSGGIESITKIDQ